MSRTRGKGRKADTHASWQDRMHNLDFSYADEKEAGDWYQAVRPIWSSCIEELVEDGWSIRITPPGSGDDYWITATGKSTEEKYVDQSYIVRYPSLENGVCLMYFALTKWGDDGRLPAGQKGSKTDWLAGEV
jgi:hypothetical protein